MKELVERAFQPGVAIQASVNKFLPKDSDHRGDAGQHEGQRGRQGRQGQQWQ